MNLWRCIVLKKIIVIILSIAFVLMVYCGMDKKYKEIYDMSNLPEGTYVESFESPNKDYVLNVYKYKNENAKKWTLRVEIEFISTGDKRNIYWNENEESAKIVWKNNDIVIINGKELNVYTDEYNFMRQI